MFYLATSIYISSHRLLWFDEVVTVHMARLPNAKTLLAALSHGADSLPPLYYMVVGIFDKLFGHSEVAVRLPSTLAMVATLLITFDCARRLTDGLHGLIAMALASGPLAGEGFEARSYAIYVMFAALALWVWTYTRTSEKWSAIWFGAVLFLGVSFHYYAVLLLVPFALWEISRWKPWQPSLPQTHCRNHRGGRSGGAALAFHPVFLAQVFDRLLEPPFPVRTHGHLLSHICGRAVYPGPEHSLDCSGEPEATRVLS